MLWAVSMRIGAWCHLIRAKERSGGGHICDDSSGGSMAESKELRCLSSRRFWSYDSYLLKNSIKIIKASFFFSDGFASADWSVRGSDGSIPPAADSSSPAVPVPVPYGEYLSSPVNYRRQHRKVLENRDLCRIVSSYIPTDEIDGKRYANIYR